MTDSVLNRFEGKTAFVSGGAGGIGWETAISLMNEGANVAICSRAGETLEQARSRKAEFGLDDLSIYEADVSDQSQLESAIGQLAADFGVLDHLVNNAGIDSFQDISDFSFTQYERVMAINVTSVFRTITTALPLLKKSKQGSIVNIGSVHGTVTTSGRADYVTSKTALIGATRALALDLGSHNIRINLVSPGAIETPMLLRGWSVKAPTENIKTLKVKAGDIHPVGRIGNPSDVASAVKFLLSDEASFITGTELLVDGGIACKIAMSGLWES